jgi:hypothetical protein
MGAACMTSISAPGLVLGHGDLGRAVGHGLAVGSLQTAPPGLQDLAVRVGDIRGDLLLIDRFFRGLFD